MQKTPLFGMRIFSEAMLPGGEEDVIESLPFYFSTISFLMFFLVKPLSCKCFIAKSISFIYTRHDRNFFPF